MYIIINFLESNGKGNALLYSWSGNMMLTSRKLRNGNGELMPKLMG